MEFAVSLKGVVHGDEERRLANRLQHFSLGARVLSGFPLLHNGGLLQHFHGVKGASVNSVAFSSQKHFSISCKERKIVVTL